MMLGSIYPCLTHTLIDIDGRKNCMHIAIVIATEKTKKNWHNREKSCTDLIILWQKEDKKKNIY
jgi:hypothetical protein